MSWLTDNRTDATTENTDNIWLKFEPLNNAGDFSQITMRILGGDPSNPSEPMGVWVHWLNNRPYNCSGFDECAVCQARKQAMRDDPLNYRKRYSINFKYFFNVLVEDNGPKVKVYSFGGGLGKKLKSYQEEYGDLRDYDIKVRKTKVGSRMQDIDYDPFYMGAKSLFTKEQIETAKTQMHDLKPFVEPASSSDLAAVARGEAPDASGVAGNSESPDTSNLLVKLEDIVAQRQMTLGDLEVDAGTSPARLQELISLLGKSD